MDVKIMLPSALQPPVNYYFFFVLLIVCNKKKKGYCPKTAIVEPYNIQRVVYTVFGKESSTYPAYLKIFFGAMLPIQTYGSTLNNIELLVLIHSVCPFQSFLVLFQGFKIF